MSQTQETPCLQVAMHLIHAGTAQRSVFFSDSPHEAFARPRRSAGRTLFPAMHSQRAQLNEANWVAVTHEPDGSLCFVYRPYGTPGMRLFMWIFFLAAIGFLFLTVYDRDVPWFFMVMFAVIAAVALGFGLWMTFGMARLRLTANELILERALCGIQCAKRIVRSSIRAVRQIDDHAEQSEPDSFPSFSLNLEGEQPCTILSRQDSDRSHYLGTEIAQWAGVPYLPAASRK
jgi:hypothetical protein